MIGCNINVPIILCGIFSGTGTGGSYFEGYSYAESFPSVPYGSNDFNDDICSTSDGSIQNYGDPNQVIQRLIFIF